MFNCVQTLGFCPPLTGLVAGLSQRCAAKNLAGQLGISTCTGNAFDGAWPIPTNSSLQAKITTYVPILPDLGLQWRIAALGLLRCQYGHGIWLDLYLA